MKIVPLGGLGEIGLNCMVFETENEILVADCGVMFSDLQLLGVDFVIPDMNYLKERAQKVKAYIITHAHEDHIGALPYALRNHPAPIYCTEFAQKLIESKLEEHGLLNSVPIHRLVPGEPQKFKDFTVTAHSVNHSIVEALALFIDTPEGKIIFTGDFKIDSHPYYGSPMDLAPFKEAGEKGVLLLMSDSTNVEREGHSLSEQTIYGKFEEIFKHNEGLIVVSMFASNIARIGQAMEIAAKLGKKVALIGRNMEQNSRIASQIGYLDHYNDVLISVDQIENIGRNKCVVLSTGSQGEYRSALVRIANNEHRAIKLREGDLVVMSSKFIPGNEKAIGKMINMLFKLGADVLYEAVSDIHVSGHANAGELRKIIEITKPKYFMPVHGEYRHLVKHAKLARSTGMRISDAVIAVNGDVWELQKNKFDKIDHFEENRVFIEGEGGNDISKVTIKDRRKVAETGIVFSVLIRNGVNDQIMAGPEIISRGLFEGTSGDSILNDAKSTVRTIIEDANAQQNQLDLQEEIRVGLRRFFNSRIGKKPVVMSIVVEV